MQDEDDVGSGARGHWQPSCNADDAGGALSKPASLEKLSLCVAVFPLANPNPDSNYPDLNYTVFIWPKY